MMPPTSACVELDGKRKRRVMKFHEMAAHNALTRTGNSESSAGCDVIDCIDIATALPPNNAPAISQAATKVTACAGLIARLVTAGAQTEEPS
jgi:hypothetical protein